MGLATARAALAAVTRGSGLAGLTVLAAGLAPIPLAVSLAILGAVPAVWPPFIPARFAFLRTARAPVPAIGRGGALRAFGQRAGALTAEPGTAEQAAGVFCFQSDRNGKRQIDPERTHCAP